MKDRKEEVSLPGPVGKIRRAVDSVRRWVQRGDPIPRTHRRSVALGAFLFFLGLATLSLVVGARLDFFLPHLNDHTGAMLLIAALALIPGGYILFVLYCCWRRYPGFDWGMIPYH